MAESASRPSFGQRSAARLFLLGVALFWGGIALIAAAAPSGDSAPPGWVLPIFGLVMAGTVILEVSIRRLARSTDRSVSWTRVRAVLPPTIISAARESGLPAVPVVVAIYGALAIGLAAMAIRGS